LVDEDGLDAENGPFLKLAVDEAIQAVKDTVEGVETVPVEMKGIQRRETAPKGFKGDQ
jgi:hypothetical protein